MCVWFGFILGDAGHPESPVLTHSFPNRRSSGLANPAFSAERGLDAALHGNWAAIDARGRARVAQALFTSLGGGIVSPAPLPDLATADDLDRAARWRSEEHTSELQSLMRISYDVFCLKKKK